MDGHKALTGVEIKDASKGEITAVFSRFDVVDSDGDVTLKGAFDDGAPVLIGAYGHASWGPTRGASSVPRPPIGKGTIKTDTEKAVLQGQFFMDMQDGRDTFESVKGCGDLQQWSYGYDIVDSEYGEFNGRKVQFLKKLAVPEISPVLAGAGVGTQTLEVKGLKHAIPPHGTATSDAGWDGAAMKANLRNDGDAAYYRSAFAWVDPEGDPNVKASYKFIHHMVSADGTVGAANITACVTGIGVLNGGRAGTTIPDSDRQGVWNHLARHIRDAGATPPTLKFESPALSDQTAAVLGDVSALVARVDSFGTNGVKEGRVLSTANRDRLSSLVSALADARTALDELLAETDPNKSRAQLQREFLRYQRELANL
jgi:hypothetical protein